MDRLREIRIPLIVGSVAVMALLLFICDYTRRGDIGSREEIGSIIFRRHGVQRKFVDEVVWERIEQGTRLANSDS
ncbi:MAG TPA: iron dicitrate transport regulator FecR, partial [Leptospiraceae bacterium]|nr:iron dicitrate transport regulator FecR [Leptospiraceae bacterium]